MIDPASLTKRYYTISEVSQLLEVNNSLLRFWETEFKEIKPQKGSNGVRRYTSKDILLLEKIHDLVKVQGYTIDGARKQLRQAKKQAPSANQLRQQRLKSILQKLYRLRDQLDQL
ncbi:MAG: MerR family transcriptional regulator [Bacteroidota bacterium]